MNKRISVKISLEKHIERVCELRNHAKEVMMKGILTKLKSQAEEILYRRGTGKPPVLHGATILDKINGKPRPPLPPNQGWKNGEVLSFARLHP